MIETIALQAEGFRFSFEVDYGRTDQEYVGMTVFFQLSSHLQGFTVHSDKTSIAVTDLQRLIEYFERHVSLLQKDSWADSDTFVNWELGFQLKALAGEIEPPNEGSFGISCMVNVGRSKGEEGHSVYVGGESNIELKEVKAFMDTIKALLEELPTLHPVVVYENPIRPAPPIRE